ncbi:unnamed protein product [Nesidiocoris tenuis]|uniref:Uncharacterized protein n=1 Tax=Nesidiocoris tenuis TaxID=355587 RepID=A0A6H5HHJ5_9HEMI|nr:unnamed protein product [Nesidiocoris tenuis]
MFDMIAELYVALDAGEFASHLLRYGMRGTQNGVAGLDVEKIQLHWIPRIDVAVREEEFPAQ